MVRLAWGVGVASCALLACAASAGARPAAPNPGPPGTVSHFDLARKDCLGTARNSTSKVWFTVAGGVLSDVYYPTADNTNVETLQYAVTDGSTFTDLQSRDMTYTVEVAARGMECRVIASSSARRYRIITSYLTDPDRNAVVMRVTFDTPRNSRLALYVLFDPTVNGNGGGGSGNGGADSATVDTSTGHSILVASDPVTITNAVNRDYAQPVVAALDGPFTEAASGFAGTVSDPRAQLDASHALTTPSPDALGGNVVQGARVSYRDGKPLTIALGFGAAQDDAIGAAAAARSSDFNRVEHSYAHAWEAYDRSLVRVDKLPERLRSAYLVSANVIKASEDKTFPGAIVASLASPWGQAVSAGDPANTYFGSYREVFARDLYEAWTGLVADGDLATARDAVRFLFDRQQLADGSMPRNSLVNGKLAPDSFGTQLDEAAYPVLMADELGMTDAALYTDHVRPAAHFLIAHGPSFGAERWEEQGGYSPSTIAAEIAGLVAAAHIADANGDDVSAAVWRGVADDWQRSIKSWTVTTNGPTAAHPYFIRLSKTGDPNAAVSYNVGNGGPTLDQRSVIDAGFLELTRLGELPANDPDVLQSLPVVDATIRADTPSGPGWHRYNGDGYGDGAADGHPWAPTGQGTGHLWPVLSAERAEQQLQTGDRQGALALLSSMQRFGTAGGLIPEQNWELPALAPSAFGTDPAIASIGFADGGPAGSAAPLTWSAAAYVRLARDLSDRALVDRPRATFDRYVAHTQGTTALTVDAPADQSAVAGSPVTVSGTSTAGNIVSVAATNVDADSATTTASAPVGVGGAWSVDVPVTGGTNVLNIVAESPAGGTAHAVRTIVFDFTPGTVLLDVTDPSNDDNGPGNYAYPTSADFKAGGFDIQRFQVLDDGTNVIFRLQTRDLSPTFGSPLGAQLVDVYVHDPAALQVSTSINAAFPQRNYQIMSGFAWNHLVEVQGFGQRFVDAGGVSAGTITIHANAISRTITFSVPKAALGSPGPGWAFTVVLTGQDGFSPDQARGFAATPQPFQFGVCATASNDPPCTVDPGTVPKVLDTVTPAGVSQAQELDYTLQSPVILQAVSIP